MWVMSRKFVINGYYFRWFYFQHKKDEKEESAPKEQKEKFLDKNIEEIELKD